jgi:hypothetical protein
MSNINLRRDLELRNGKRREEGCTGLLYAPDSPRRRLKQLAPAGAGSSGKIAAANLELT